MRYYTIEELYADPKIREIAINAANAGGRSLDDVLWAMLQVMNWDSSAQDAAALQESIIQSLDKDKQKK